MSSELILALLALLALAGAAAAAFLQRELRAAEGRIAALGADLSGAKARLEGADAAAARAQADAHRTVVELADARREAAEARERLARVEAELQTRSTTVEEHRKDLETRMAAIASETLAATQKQFIGLANETFEKHSQAAQGGVKEVVTPVQEQLAKLAETVAELDKKRIADGAALGATLKSVAESMSETRAVTGQLVTALKANSKTRGNWGEQTLRNVLELAGLSRHADFTEQADITGDDGKLRPDVVIRMPGGGVIVVDAKVALTGFFEAIEASDEVQRETAMKRHAAQVRLHVQKLAKTDYSTFVPNAVDFVAMFIPGENFFAAATERDPDLFEYAVKNKVIIVTPATLVALAKSVAYGWRQEEAAQNAQHIADLGRELYRRLATMADKLASVGGAIERTVKTYNEAASSFEARLLPQGRRFRDLGAGDPAVEIRTVEGVDLTPRLLAAPEDHDTPPLAVVAPGAPPAEPKRRGR